MRGPDSPYNRPGPRPTTYREVILDALSQKRGANSPFSNLNRLHRGRQQLAQREAKRSGDRSRRALIRRGELTSWIALANERRFGDGE